MTTKQRTGDGEPIKRIINRNSSTVTCHQIRFDHDAESKSPRLTQTLYYTLLNAATGNPGAARNMRRNKPLGLRSVAVVSMEAPLSRILPG